MDKHVEAIISKINAKLNKATTSKEPKFYLVFEITKDEFPIIQQHFQQSNFNFFLSKNKNNKKYNHLCQVNYTRKG